MDTEPFPANTAPEEGPVSDSETSNFAPRVTALAPWHATPSVAATVGVSHRAVAIRARLQLANGLPIYLTSRLNLPRI